MADDLDTLIGLMPFATQLGITLIAASPDAVIAELAWAPRRVRPAGSCTAAR